MSRRDQLLDVLGQCAMRGGYGVGVLGSERLTDALLPLVDRLCAEAAAEALVGMADAVRTTEVLFRRDDGSGVKFGDLLRERAAATRAAAVNPSKEQQP